MKPRFGLPLLFLLLASVCFAAESKCTKGCDLALASYYVWVGFSNMTWFEQIMQSQVLNGPEDVVKYNKGTTTVNYIQTTTRVNVPFPCDCIGGEYLGHLFKYPLQPGDTYTSVANQSYSNLTTVSSLESLNSYRPTDIPDSGTLNVTINCSCGNSEISKDYGLFITYPLRAEDSLQSIANQTNLDPALLQRYNPGVNFSQGSGLVYIPGKDENGTYVSLPKSTTGLAGGVIAGISVGAVAGVLILAACILVVYYRNKKVEKEKLLSEEARVFTQHGKDSNGPAAGVDTGITGITVDKSVEFSYEELAHATSNFSMANKIGQGGFGEVYYAELREEKAAVKKMKMEASREFLAELRVLTNVHHLNLVRLIGYCVEHSLFLVYEYIENGNLSQHLRDPGREPMAWSTRLQIALDSARGLEYIHEHTVPVYIHRDIKSANILIDKNFRGKVADFGLTKLTEVGSSSIPTGQIGGTFGYMPPENAYGSVSPKIDVYAFGVVLYELISAKEAVTRDNESGSGMKGLVSLFEKAFEQPDPKEALKKLVDPRLGDDYSIDSVHKMAQLGQVCTESDPQLRPSMRSIVVALMALSSTTVEWDIASLYENPTLAYLMTGR